MVLQQKMRNPVWGWAAPGENVTVSLGGHRETATADGSGRWQLRLPPMKAGGPYEMTVSGGNAVTVHNVAVGEVWVASGQSNMEWNLGWETTGYKEEIAAANFPMIRMMTVDKTVAGGPKPDVAGKWEVSGPETAGHFSAVGYHFAKELHRALGVPVGIIHTSWGGTPAESWTRISTLAADSALRPVLDRWDRTVAGYPEARRTYERQRREWQKAADAAKAEGKPAPPEPRAPEDPLRNPWWPGSLYNGMIAPLVPYGIKGAIWYQGESNADRAYQYRTLFPTMIRDWRRAWGQGDFPFLFVQLANFMPAKEEPGEDAWAELREAQTKTLSLPKTGMASAIDVGDAVDIHPRNKREVGRRLALNALAIAYGRDEGEYAGPLYRSRKVEGGRVRLKFDHAEGGLSAKDGAPLKGFAVAGADRKFVWANAEIDGDEVVVWSDAVPRPAAVRYGWASTPPSTLYNKDGLPASPFRTDDWPGVTVNNR
jgi:sialate O-acetylesterase